MADTVTGQIRVAGGITESPASNTHVVSGQIGITGAESDIVGPGTGPTDTVGGQIAVEGAQTDTFVIGTPNPPPVVPPTVVTGVIKLVREMPPTRISTSIETPKGKFYRWGQDEPSGQNVPSGIRQSTVAPGGYESLDVTLPRSPRIDYADLEPLSTIRTMGAGGEVIGEYRLEGVPSTSGDQFAISPSAVGWQQHLSDKEDASVIFIDRDMSRWTTTSTERQAWMAENNFVSSGSVGVNPGATPELQLDIQGINQANPRTNTNPTTVAEAYYDAGPGNVIQETRAEYQMQHLAGTCPKNSGDPPGWCASWFITDPSSDPAFQTPLSFHTTPIPILTDIPGGSQRSQVAIAPVNARPDTDNRWTAALIQLFFNGAWDSQTQGDIDWKLLFQNLRVIGTHGKQIRGTSSASEGILASDAVQYIIDQFCPFLHADASTIQQSTFIIPHLRFDQTTPSEMISASLAFAIPTVDWFVWNNRIFYVHMRNTNNRQWRARMGPTRLSETGPALDQLWNEVTVSFTDVSGATKTVTPEQWPDFLRDSDPENPLNQMGLVRRRNLSLGITSTDVVTVDTPVPAPVRVGNVFLEEAKLISRAGQAEHVGHIEDINTGVFYPAYSIRAGDVISYVDAADPSPRRVTHTDYDDSSRTCTVSLDAPPDSMQGLLARLGIVTQRVITG